MGIGGFFSWILRTIRHKRRSSRDPMAHTLTYLFGMDNRIGQAEIVNINKGGFCLEMEDVVEVETELTLRVNPHVIKKYINTKIIKTDEQGRYRMKVVWVKPKDDGSGCFVGGVFLKADGSLYSA